MEEKSINIIISNSFPSVQKISTGVYEVTLNEELDDSWEEVALYELSMPISREYTNLPSNAYIHIKASLDTTYVVTIPSGNYTIDTLTKTVNTDVSKLRTLNTQDPYCEFSFKKVKDTNLVNMKIFPQPNINPNFRKYALLFTSKPFTDFLGFKYDDSFLIDSSKTTNITATKESQIAYKKGLLITTIDWVQHQTSNLTQSANNAIDIENIINVKGGDRLYIKNDHHLVWFKMAKSVKKTIRIKFTDGLNYFDASSGQTIFLQLLVRKKIYNI